MEIKINFIKIDDRIVKWSCLVRRQLYLSLPGIEHMFLFGKVRSMNFRIRHVCLSICIFYFLNINSFFFFQINYYCFWERIQLKLKCANENHYEFTTLLSLQQLHLGCCILKETIFGTFITSLFLHK
jgi:hypothetical protein